MKAYRYLFFDLDGTLTDSREGIINCLVYALEQMGFDIPEDKDKFLGPSLYQSFAEFCGMDDEQVERAVKLFRGRYSVTGLFENRVYDGIPEMLERLKNGGKELFVATSKPQPYAVRILEKFGLAHYFRFIGGADINGTRNRKQEVIEYVLAESGIADRESVLMIGDRRQDVLGAHDTGLDCLGILWGYGPEEELLEAGADYIAHTPQAAADMLLG
ncbi:MAG: HAD-IA family hydrolase [Ruminococcus sp.]|nr:HAD-IA family hydrolase [Ruminococcus sp.]